MNFTYTADPLIMSLEVLGRPFLTRKENDKSKRVFSAKVRLVSPAAGLDRRVVETTKFGILSPADSSTYENIGFTVRCTPSPLPCHRACSPIIPPPKTSYSHPTLHGWLGTTTTNYLFALRNRRILCRTPYCVQLLALVSSSFCLLPAFAKFNRV